MPKAQWWSGAVSPQISAHHAIMFAVLNHCQNPPESESDKTPPPQPGRRLTATVTNTCRPFFDVFGRTDLDLELELPSALWDPPWAEKSAKVL